MLLHSSLYLCFGYFLKHIVWKMTIDSVQRFVYATERKTYQSSRAQVPTDPFLFDIFLRYLGFTMTRFPPCLGGLSKYQLNFSKCIHCIPCVSFNKVVFISPTSTRRPVIFPVYNKNSYFSDFKRKKADTVYLPDTQVSPETPKLKKKKDSQLVIRHSV